MPRHLSRPSPTAQKDWDRNWDRKLLPAAYLAQSKVARQDPPVQTITSTSVVTHPPTTTTITTSLSSSPGTTNSNLVTLSTPLTSVFASSVVSSDSYGIGYTSVVQITQTFPAGSTITASSSTSSHSTSNLGIIIGAAVGGAAVLGILGFVLFYICRRRKIRFDGNFDPGYVGGGGTLPKVELSPEDDGVGGRLANNSVSGGFATPFPNNPRPPSQSEMRQPYGDGRTGATAAAYGAGTPHKGMSPPHSPPLHSPPPRSYYSGDGYYPGQQVQGQYPQPGGSRLGQQGDWRGVSSGPPTGTAPSSTGTSASLSGGIVGARSHKEQEALAHYGAQVGSMGVANPGYDPSLRGVSDGERQGPYGEPAHQVYTHGRRSASIISQQSFAPGPGYGPTQVGGPSAERRPEVAVRPEVVVHQDMEAMQAQEIPPTYDSIPSAERR